MTTSRSAVLWNAQRPPGAATASGPLGAFHKTALPALEVIGAGC